MNLKESAFAQRPTLLGAQPESPECEQFDSAREDAKEEDSKATSALDAKLDTSMGEETDALSWAVPPKELRHAPGAHLGAKGISEAQE